MKKQLRRFIKLNEDEIKKFCNEWLSAWTGNNPDKLISFYSENAYYQDPAKPKGIIGQREIKAYFTKLLTLNPNWKWEMEEGFPNSKGFTFKWKATIPVGNTIIIESGMDIIEIENGRIIRNEVYFDRTKMLEEITKLKKIA